MTKAASHATHFGHRDDEDEEEHKRKMEEARLEREK